MNAAHSPQNAPYTTKCKCHTIEFINFKTNEKKKRSNFSFKASPEIAKEMT